MSEFDRLVHMDGWIGETPDGTDAAYLLLTTNAEQPEAAMSAFAMAALGFNPMPGSVTMNPIEDAHVEVGTDLWIRLHAGGDHFTRPVSSEWAALALAQRRVVVTVGYAPMPDGADPITYAEQASAAGRVVLGLLPARPAEGGTR